MRIVFISICEPEDIYLIQSVKDAGHDVLTIKWRSLSPARSIFAKLRRPFSSLYYLISDLFYEMIEFRKSRFLKKYFFNTANPPRVHDLEIPENLLHHPSTTELIRLHKPDILISSGAPILREAILSIPKRESFNIHHGIAPKYRGMHTLFWSLYKNDLENTGFTIHRLDDTLDGGRLIAHVYPTVNSKSTEASLVAEGIKLTTQKCIDYLKQIDTNTKVNDDPINFPLGKNYLMKERRIKHDLILLVKRIFKLHGYSSRPHKIISYC